MKPHSTKGIILRRVDFAEADRIITFLTSDYGKIHAIAKGVRKQKSKLAGGIELFSISELQFIKGKRDIDTIISTRLIKHYGTIVTNLERTELGYHFLKIIDKTVEDGAGSEYFEALLESLAELNELDVPQNIAELSFCMRVLQLLGQVPQFGIDAKGNKLNENENFEFDFESVAFVPKDNGPFTKNHIKMLKLLAYNSPQKLRVVESVEKYCQELAPLVKGLLLQYVPGAY